MVGATAATVACERSRERAGASSRPPLEGTPGHVPDITTRFAMGIFLIALATLAICRRLAVSASWC
jgi:hypothetical protein